MSTIASSPPGRSPRRSVRLYCLMTFFQGMIFYAPVAALYRQYRGVSYFQMTVIESVSLALAILLEIPWGMVADRIGYKRSILICNALFFLSKVIFWRAEGFGGFMTERILLSVVTSGLSGVDTAYLSRLTQPEERQRVFGVKNAFETAGLVIAAGALPFVLDEGYRLAAMLTVASYGVALLLTLPMMELPSLPLSRSSSLSAQWRALRGALPSRRMLLLLVSAAVLYETNQTFLGQLLWARVGIDVRWFGPLFLGLMALGLAAPLSQRLTGLLGKRRTPLLLLLATALCCGLLAVTRSPLLTVAGLSLIKLCYALFLPWFTAMQAQATAEEGRATALSVQSAVMNLMNMGVELTFGRLSSLSLSLTMGAAGLFCTLGLLCCVLSMRTTGAKR